MAQTPQIPRFREVLEARKRIRPHLSKTRMVAHPKLSAMVGATVMVKHENENPTGSFKVRGGINLVSQLSAQERKSGLIAASTGNHGQSVSYAGRLFGVKVQILVPQGANPIKIASMRSMGAEVQQYGEDFDTARERVEHLAAVHGYRYVHSAVEPDLVAGVATYSLEMFEEAPGLDVIIVPVGGGSSASGTCLVAKTIAPDTKVIGVQAAAAPTAYQSWRAGRIVEAEMNTECEGLATRSAFPFTQDFLRANLDDFVLVSESEIREAIRMMIESTGSIVEGAGATPLAAALKMKSALAGKTVGLVLSGGNLSPEKLQRVFSN